MNTIDWIQFLLGGGVDRATAPTLFAGGTLGWVVYARSLGTHTWLLRRTR